MDSLQLHFHPGLVRHRAKSWRHQQHMLHLGQGSIDAASGILCIFMALMAMGMVSKSQLQVLGFGTDYRLGTTWRRGLESYFIGASETDVLDLLTTLPGIEVQSLIGPTSRCVEMAQSRLALNELALLGLAVEVARPIRWVLAVGTELGGGGSENTATSLLCLDPAESSPRVAPFNTRLCLNSPRRGSRQLHYVTATALLSPSCGIAIALSKRR